MEAVQQKEKLSKYLIPRTEQLVSWCHDAFKTLNSKMEEKNAVSFYQCCDVFCTRYYPGAKEHDQTTKITYAKLSEIKKIRSASDLREALQTLSEKKDQTLIPAFIPSIDTPHFEQSQSKVEEDVSGDLPKKQSNNKRIQSQDAKLQKEVQYLEKRFGRTHDAYMEQLTENRKLEEVNRKQEEVNRNQLEENKQLRIILQNLLYVVKDCSDCSCKFKEVFWSEEKKNSLDK